MWGLMDFVFICHCLYGLLYIVSDGKIFKFLFIHTFKMPREFAYRFVDSEKAATSYQGPNFSEVLPTLAVTVDRKLLGDDIPSNWNELIDLISDLCHDACIPSIWFYTRVAYEWINHIENGSDVKKNRTGQLSFDEYEQTTINVITPITGKENKKTEKSNVVQKKESGILFRYNSNTTAWSSLAPLTQSDFRDSLHYHTLGLVFMNCRISEKTFTKGELINLIMFGVNVLEEPMRDLKSIILSLHVLAHLCLAFPSSSVEVVLHYD